MSKTGCKEIKITEWEGSLELSPENSGIQEAIFRSENVSDVDRLPRYDEQYLVELREKAKQWLDTVDCDSWLREIRGK